MTDSILFWNAVALEANCVSHSDPDKREQNGPTLSSRALAIDHLAMYDAYAGVENNAVTFPRYLPTPPPPPRARPTGMPSRARLSPLYPGCSKLRETFSSRSSVVLTRVIRVTNSESKSAKRCSKNARTTWTPEIVVIRSRPRAADIALTPTIRDRAITRRFTERSRKALPSPNGGHWISRRSTIPST